MRSGRLLYLQRMLVDLVLVIPLWALTSLHVKTIAVSVLLQLTPLVLSGVYRFSWKFINIYHMGILLVSILPPAFYHIIRGEPDLRVIFFTSIATAFFLFLHRLIFFFILNPEAHRKKAGELPIIIYGAGTVAMHLLHDLSRSDMQNKYQIAAVVDNDAKKIGTRFGAYIIQSGRDLTKIVQDYSVKEIWFTMPVTPEFIQTVLGEMQQNPVQFKVVPRKIAELIPDIRSLRIEDLIQRPEIRLSREPVDALLRGKRVLITGAAGSIGREIAHQVMASAPARMVMLDQWERGVYELEREFTENGATAFIADVRDARRIREVLLGEKPHFIFHAAAYKHVPLMETNYSEAVRTNILGLNNLLNGVRDLLRENPDHSLRFVNISTDKAVSPENIMGLTKRISELLIHNTNLMLSRDKQFADRFHSVSVRFGNVLGSSGSVVPLFLEQIRAGGPLTVTHADMERFFMTIPEAVNLVLHAMNISQGNDILALDMGKPIRITDLAERLILLSGKTPHKDIEIVYTGIRPGEKLKEELFWKKGSVQTSNPYIFRSEDDLKEAEVERIVKLIQEALQAQQSLHWWKDFLNQFV